MSENQFVVKAVSSSYWEVTFNNPPINLIDPNTIAQLNALIGKIESDPTLNIVVFKSNDPDFFIAHYDVSSVAAFAALPPRLVSIPGTMFWSASRVSPP